MNDDSYDIESCMMMLGEWRGKGEQKICVKIGEYTTLCRNKTAVLLGQLKHDDEKLSLPSELFYLATFGDYMKKMICKHARGTKSFVRLSIAGGWYIRLLYLRIDKENSTEEYFTTGGTGPRFNYELSGLNIDTLADRKDEEIKIQYLRPWQAPGVSDAYKIPKPFDLSKVNWDT